MSLVPFAGALVWPLRFLETLIELAVVMPKVPGNLVWRLILS